MEVHRPAEPFALDLLKEYQHGKSVEALSREAGIPIERINVRLRAAALYMNRAAAGRRMTQARTRE